MVKISLDWYGFTIFKTVLTPRSHLAVSFTQNPDKVNNVELLLTVNSALLGLVGLLLGFVGFFLKDLHRKFSRMVERVNNLYTKLSTEATASTIHRKQEEKEMTTVKGRISRIENKLLG